MIVLVQIESQVIDFNIKTIIELQFENKILSSENGNIVMVTSSRNKNNLQLTFFSLSHLSNMHNKELLDPHNLVNQVEKLIRFDDVEGTYHIIISKPKTILENHDIIPNPQTNIQKFLYWFNNSLLYIAIIIIFTILVIVVIHKCIHPIET